MNDFLNRVINVDTDTEESEEAFSDDFSLLSRAIEYRKSYSTVITNMLVLSVLLESLMRGIYFSLCVNSERDLKIAN